VYLNAVDSSSFLCRRCCRPLAVCCCASTYGCEKSSGNDYVDLRRRSNGAEKSASDDGLTPPGSRSARDVPYSGRRRVNVDGRGRDEVELRRMMDSLDTIDVEWTSGRPTRSASRQMTSVAASDLNNNNNSSRQRRQSNESDVTDGCRPSRGHLDQREIGYTFFYTGRGALHRSALRCRAAPHVSNTYGATCPHPA